MKRLVCCGLVLAMLGGVTAPVSAARPHDRDRYEEKPRQERHQVHRDDDRAPLKWGKHRGDFDGHHMRRLHDNKLERRYPGLHGYRWNGHGDGHRGFWHRDRYVKDGIIFFDRDDRMAGFGYFHEGVFIFVEEHDYHEERGDLIFLLLLMKLLEMQD